MQDSGGVMTSSYTDRGRIATMRYGFGSGHYDVPDSQLGARLGNQTSSRIQSSGEAVLHYLGGVSEASTSFFGLAP